MPFAELVVDAFSGADDADIDGRVPDGGGDGAKAVGAWLKNAAVFDLSGDNVLALVGNTVRQIGGDDFWDSVYTVQGIPGLTANQYGRLVGQFANLDDFSWMGLALRFDDADNTGYYIYVTTDGDLTVDFSDDWNGYTHAVTVPVSIAAGVDFELVAASEGNMIRLYVDGGQLLCLPHSVIAIGAPGLDFGDTSGDGSRAIVRAFSAGNGNPFDTGGTTVIDLSVMKSLGFLTPEAMAVRHKGAWVEPVVGAVREKGEWKTFLELGTSAPGCDEVATGNPFRNLLYLFKRILGPDGAGLASTMVDPALPAYVEVAASKPDAEFSLYQSPYLYVPGTGGINRFNPGTSGLSPGAVTGWALPGDGLGVAYRGAKNYVGTFTSLFFSSINGAATSDTHSNDRTYFTDPSTGPSITYGDITFYGVMNGANFEIWVSSSCPTDDLYGEGIGNPHLLHSYAPTDVGFPGDNYPDATVNSRYICNYLEIVNSVGPTILVNYGVICSRPIGSSLKVDTEILNSSFPTACPPGVNVATPDDIDFAVLFGPLPNWTTEAAHLFVGCPDNGTIWAIDLTTGTVAYSFDSGLSTGVRGMTTINDDLVVCGANGVVKRFAYGTNDLVWSVDIGTDAYYCEHVISGTTVWVSSPTDGTVVVVDTATGAILHTITVGVSPRQIAYHPQTRTVYVANQGDDTISKISISTFAVTETLAMTPGSEPWGLCYNGAGAVWAGFATPEPLTAV